MGKVKLPCSSKMEYFGHHDEVAAAKFGMLVCVDSEHLSALDFCNLRLKARWSIFFVQCMYNFTMPTKRMFLVE